MVADDEPEINRIAKGHDYFVNLYRYRGANPLEVNMGYSSDYEKLNERLLFDLLVWFLWVFPVFPRSSRVFGPVT